VSQGLFYAQVLTLLFRNLFLYSPEPLKANAPVGSGRGDSKTKRKVSIPFQTDRQHLTTSQLSTKSEVVTSTEHARRMIRRGLWPIYRLGKKAIRIDVEEIKKLTRGYEEPVKEN